MPKRSPLPNACMLARSLELLGEWWTLLIVRDAFFGIRHFEAFQASLGIARNVLSTRLLKLVEAGILTRSPDPTDGRRIEYRLTAKGRALLPVIVGLAQWGAKHLRDEGQPLPYWFVERATGERLPQVAVRNGEGRDLVARDLAIVEGPGMTDDIRATMPNLLRPQPDRQAA
jgi:DNA-binding HxlR family transcriptional regulator